MSINLIQHLMQQITLKVKLVNKIIFRSNNAKIFQFKNRKQKQNQVVKLK